LDVILTTSENPFGTDNMRKGNIGEMLSSYILPELFPDGWMLDNKDTIVSEEIAYGEARDFLIKHPDIQCVFVNREFSGGQSYAVDRVDMIITRQDLENWFSKWQSTARYLVFECKADSSKLTESQSHFNYVEKQAQYMSTNTRDLEDRKQLGKDLLAALQNNRVTYIHSHLSTSSGRLTASEIAPQASELIQVLTNCENL
jgi:hypothetical protein